MNTQNNRLWQNARKAVAGVAFAALVGGGLLAPTMASAQTPGDIARDHANMARLSLGLGAAAVYEGVHGHDAAAVALGAGALYAAKKADDARREFRGYDHYDRDHVGVIVDHRVDFRGGVDYAPPVVIEGHRPYGYGTTAWVDDHRPVVIERDFHGADPRFYDHRIDDHRYDDHAFDNRRFDDHRFDDHRFGGDDRRGHDDSFRGGDHRDDHRDDHGRFDRDHHDDHGDRHDDHGDHHDDHHH